MTFEELQTATLDWASARGILANGTVQAQFTKLVEEVGELAGGIARHDAEAIADALGDTLVVLIILAELLGADPVACLEGAYKVILPRKGYLNASGVFIKEEETK